MTSELELAFASTRHDPGAAAPLAPPPGRPRLPEFEQGWLLKTTGEPAPFLSYVEADASVNWSDELELLHEESSRRHFLDRWTRDAIMQRLGPLPSRPVIADIGCSTGYLLEELDVAHPSATLLGVDLVGTGLVKAHRLVPSARLVRADCCRLPIADAALDALVSANLLEHVRDDFAALREFARVLRPGARAVIVVPAGPATYDYYDRFLGHERRYGRLELASKCVSVGLEVVEDRYIGAVLYPAFWTVKQRNRRVYGHLRGAGLEAQVAADIARTRDSRLGHIGWWLERRLDGARIRPPFGIRSLVVARRLGPGS